MGQMVAPSDELVPYWTRLKQLRKRAGLSQPELYRDSGVSFGMIRALETPYRDEKNGATNRSRYPTVEVLEKLSAALGVEPATFPEYRLARARELLDERAHGLEEALRCLDAFDAAQRRLAEEATASAAQPPAATDRPERATGHGSHRPAGGEPAS
jgi:transcriptional regulator with XRE-family HTH domain